MIPTGTKRLAALLTLGLSGGCYTNAKGLALEQRVLATEAWQEQFRQTYDAERQRLSESLLAAEQSLAALHDEVGAMREQHQRLLAELGSRVDGISQDVNAIRGRTEEGSFSSTQLRQEIELLRQEIEIQLAALRDE